MRPQEPLDDWLGDVSDDDWSEESTRLAQRSRTAAAHGGLPVSADDRHSPHSDRPPPERTAADAHRAAIERRRLVAVLGVAAVLGLAAVLTLLLLRGGDNASAPPVSVPVATTPAPGGQPSSTPTTTPTTPTTTPSTTPSTPAPSTGPTSGFSLPEGTKLQLGGENDAALVRQLQQALTKAGYNPGAADGTFGKQTEQAVVAFQQDNGLAVDGRVGPETAAALNSAITGG